MSRKDGKPRILPQPLTLDPLPMLDALAGRRFACADEALGYVFWPRPGYSQNPEDYE